MIRMGRKTEPINETPAQQQPMPPSNSQYLGANVAAPPNRPVTESESMARDIKEGRLSGFIGSGTMLSGDTTFQAMLRVDGHLTGSVSSEHGTLIVGSTGRVDANISVAAAMINGTVNGDVTVTERLELGRAARIVGNVQTPRLVIEDGAVLEGSCKMVTAKENLDKRAVEASSHKSSDQHTSFGTEEASFSPEAEDEQTLTATNG